MSDQNQMFTDSIEINWEEISDEAPPPLADGIYFANFAEANFQKTKAGKPGAKIVLNVTKAHGGQDDSLKRKIFDNPVFSVESAFRVKQLAKSAGVTLPSPITLESVEEFCAALVASPGVWIRTKQSTFEGKTNAKIDRYFTEAQVAEATGGAAPSASDESSAGGRRRRGAAA